MELRLRFVSALFLLGVTFVVAANLPGGLQFCKDDNKINECVMQQFQTFKKNLIKGDPKYKLPSLLPLVVDKIAIKQSGNRNVAYINMLLKNSKVYGLENVQFTKSMIDPKKKLIHWEFNSRRLDIIADYELDGKFLLVPIVGQGKANFTSVNDSFTIDITYTLEKRKGIDYIKFNKPESTHSPKSGSVKLDNLFNGDKALGEAVNAMLNENISELLEQFAPAIGKALVNVLYDVMSNLTKNIPYSQFFPK